MTDNEKLAVDYFKGEMNKVKNNMSSILINQSNMTDEEFSRYMHTELTRYDKCKKMIEYYYGG